jgi:N-carbamoyl-L-amino-acid hydrolase
VWLDARAAHPAALDAWLDGLGVPVESKVALDGVEFDPPCGPPLRAPADAATPPEILCFAGHDAGMVAEHLPAGMILVRNEAGTSHAPSEHVELDGRGGGGHRAAPGLERLA